MTTEVQTITDTPYETVDGIVSAAAAAAAPLRALDPGARARLLEGVADALDAEAAALVAVAREETHLPEPRLYGEVARTSGQLRMFAAALREGSFVEAIIDTALPSAVPPRPDLRRMLIPIGPTLVFAASNFPFAFSVAGSDTASALAAGCPVVVKAHPGHPRLSALVGHLLEERLVALGAPTGTLAVVHGIDAGVQALQDPRIKAAAFTGSTHGGRALADLAAARPEPIPFYGELGSTNPVFVTRAAVATRGEEIARDFVASYTLGVGQFCTKPGLLILPAGHGLEPALTAAVRNVAAARMLDERLHEGYASGLNRLLEAPGVRIAQAARPDDGFRTAPTLLATTLAAVRDDPGTLLTECFGPVSLIVDYDDEDELVPFALGLEGQLTATIHAEEDDARRLAPLTEALADRAGRVVWNGWPTGVAVSWSMHHGGPYPATTAPLHTAVGATAVRRFLRPVCFQDTPQALLPAQLRDDNPSGWTRRIDGELTRSPVKSPETDASLLGRHL
jgi:NADP-dependent aldehyde dehydrogenase